MDQGPNRKLKVLQIGKYYWPQPGGMERVLTELSEGLVSQGHEVHSLISHNHHQLQQEVVRGVHVYRLPTWGKFLSNPMTWWSPQWIKRINPDIVHFHSPNPLPLKSYLPVGVPSVLTYHADVDKSPWLQRLYAKYFLDALEKVDVVTLASSRILQSSVFRSSLEAKQPRIIPYGVLDSRFSISSNIKSPQLPIDVLFVGRLVPYKGIEVLLKAMSQVSGQLVIVGSGPEERRLKGLVQTWGLRGKIQFLGFVKDELLTQLYMASRVVVLPSVTKSEAFGLTLVEAGACGKPCVTTSISTGVMDIIVHGETGYVVPPGDVQELATSINRLLSDSPLRLRMGITARRRFLERYQRFAMVEAFEKLYKELLGPAKEKALPKAKSKSLESPLSY